MHLTPPPVQYGGREIYVGGYSDPAYDRAIRRCDGHLGHITPTPKQGVSVGDDPVERAAASERAFF